MNGLEKIRFKDRSPRTIEEWDKLREEYKTATGKELPMGPAEEQLRLMVPRE